MAMTEQRLRNVLAGLVIALLAVPVGGALWLGVAHGESPCILCWTQRTSMVLMALVALFVVRYGPRPRYVGVLVLLGAWGTFMALRHSGLHLARDVGQGFSGSILGAHTYTWSWVIHWLVLLAAGALLLLLRGPLAAKWGPEPGRAGRFAMGMLVVMAGANAVQAFVSTGPPPYIGQSDPVRLSLDPRQWVWSMDALNGPVSWRGSWTIPQPNPSAADPDPAMGPLEGLPVLPIQAWERITAALDGNLAGLAVMTGDIASGDIAPGDIASGDIARRHRQATLRQATSRRATPSLATSCRVTSRRMLRESSGVTVRRRADRIASSPSRTGSASTCWTARTRGCCIARCWIAASASIFRPSSAWPS
jgi:disulfide bond formation protein DsbB